GIRDFHVTGVQTCALPISNFMPRAVYVVATLVVALALATLAIGTSGDQRIAVTFVGAAIFAFLVLRVVGWAVQALARRSPRVRRSEERRVGKGCRSRWAP